MQANSASLKGWSTQGANRIQSKHVIITNDAPTEDHPRGQLPNRGHEEGEACQKNEDEDKISPLRLAGATQRLCAGACITEEISSQGEGIIEPRSSSQLQSIERARPYEKSTSDMHIPFRIQTRV